MSQGLSRSSRMERRAGTPLLALFLCTSMLSAQAQQNAPSTPQAQQGTQTSQPEPTPNAPMPQPAPAQPGLRSRSLSRSGSARPRAWPFRTRIIRSMRTDPRWCPSRIWRTRSACISSIRDGKLYISLQDAIDAGAGEQSRPGDRALQPAHRRHRHPAHQGRRHLPRRQYRHRARHARRRRRRLRLRRSRSRRGRYDGRRGRRGRRRFRPGAIHARYGNRRCPPTIRSSAAPPALST